MEETRYSLILNRYAVAIIFLSFTVGALVTFGYHLYTLAHDLVNESKIISFNKGSIYMLGVGLGAGFLTYAFVLEILKKSISARFNNCATRIGVMIILLIFALPQLMHLAIDRYAKTKGYRQCHSASYQWLHVRNIIYVANTNVCTDLNENKN